jgi:hypothetical protein
MAFHFVDNRRIRRTTYRLIRNCASTFFSLKMICKYEKFVYQPQRSYFYRKSQNQREEELLFDASFNNASPHSTPKRRAVVDATVP